MRNLFAGLALGSIMASAAVAAGTETAAFPDEQHPIYVQIIVKACPPVETPLKPINQGKSYDNEKSMTREERNAAFAQQGCIDVPVPMEWVTGPMTPEACRGRDGFLTAMEFLDQRQDLAGLKAVGAWECLITDHEVAGAISQ